MLTEKQLNRLRWDFAREVSPQPLSRFQERNPSSPHFVANLVVNFVYSISFPYIFPIKLATKLATKFKIIAIIFPICIGLSLIPLQIWAQDSSHKSVERSIDAGLGYLRKAQNADGSFGAVQRHLQTGLAILAFLSAGATPGSDPASPLPLAAKWILDNSGEDGFLGDSEYPLESHAVAALALSELIGQVHDAELDRRLTLRADDALEYSLRVQDKAVNPEFYGGWKANLKTKANDRRVTAWFLFFLRSMEIRGRRIPVNSPKRALSFLEGSQKVPGPGKEYEKEDIGGFSYDAAGLPIVTITGAGLACMGLYDRPVKQRDLALDWLSRNRPLWYGPNFYYANFFAARGYISERGRGDKQAEQTRAFFNSLRGLLLEHQNPDGSFQIPPGNAENTKVMGGSYATPMAILILDAERGILPLDNR